MTTMNNVLEAMAANVRDARGTGPQNTIALLWGLHVPLSDVSDYDDAAEKERCMRAVRDALTAAEHLGYVLVPIEATNDMLAIGRSTTDEDGILLYDAWRAMIAARPNISSKEDGKASK